MKYARAGILLPHLPVAEEHQSLKLFRRAREDASIATFVEKVQRKAGRR